MYPLEVKIKYQITLLKTKQIVTISTDSYFCKFLTSDYEYSLFYLMN